jgi:hypothetical protein
VGVALTGVKRLAVGTRHRQTGDGHRLASPELPTVLESVAKYMGRRQTPPSQTWRTFLENHVKDLVSVDFFTVPTIRFQVLYVFLVLAHDR